MALVNQSHWEHWLKATMGFILYSARTHGKRIRKCTAEKSESCQFRALSPGFCRLLKYDAITWERAYINCTWLFPGMLVPVGILAID